MSSCIVPESTHVEPTFHLLSAIDFDQNDSGSEETNHFSQDEDLPGCTFYLKQIEVPSYLQENRIISRLQKGKIEFRENKVDEGSMDKQLFILNLWSFSKSSLIAKN